MADLERFLELYRSVGEAVSVTTIENSHHQKMFIGKCTGTKYITFHTEVLFDKNGKFLKQSPFNIKI